MGLYATNLFSQIISNGVPSGLFGKGIDWMDRLNGVCNLLQPNGGTILIDDSEAGNAQTIGTIPSNIILRFTGRGTFGFTQMNIGTFTKIYSSGSKLVMLQSNAIGINLATQASMQTDDKCVLDGLRIEGAGLSNTTGIFLGASHAEVYTRNCSVSGCAVGMYDTSQFHESHNDHLWNNTVNLKVVSIPVSGGGNSNAYYDLQTVNSTVDILIYTLGAFSQGGIQFYNLELQSASVCGLAVFGNPAGATGVHLWGGSPEINGDGASSITIDGQLIKQASVYANNANVYWHDLENAEPSISPSLLAENGSTIYIGNASGYGSPGGIYGTADASSQILMADNFSGIGCLFGVTKYPNMIAAIPRESTKIIGAPLVVFNSNVPNAYTGNPKTIIFTDTAGSLSSGTSSDPLYGLVSTITHATSSGGQDNNRFRIASPVGVVQANSDSSVILHIMSNVDCSYQVAWYGNNLTQAAPIPLKAGQWRRVIMVIGNQAPGEVGNGIVGFPKDSSGPTISVFALQTNAGLTGTSQLQQQLAQVLSTGAVNPNGH